MDGCWIVCWVLVLVDESGQLKVMEDFDGDGFEVVSFAVVVEK